MCDRNSGFDKENHEVHAGKYIMNHDHGKCLYLREVFTVLSKVW